MCRSSRRSLSRRTWSRLGGSRPFLVTSLAADDPVGFLWGCIISCSVLTILGLTKTDARLTFSLSSVHFGHSNSQR
ncbi:hypothetical protein BDR03DRAFT_955859 [Suillus americanus]|nr:hypothetical protein BDR03DRAFT_955859 [Suillus americanus]